MRLRFHISFSYPVLVHEMALKNTLNEYISIEMDSSVAASLKNPLAQNTGYYKSVNFHSTGHRLHKTLKYISGSVRYSRSGYRRVPQPRKSSMVWIWQHDNRTDDN